MSPIAGTMRVRTTKVSMSTPVAAINPICSMKATGMVMRTANVPASSAERTAALHGWLDHYNVTRRHGSLGKRAPAARLAELNNLAGNHT